MKEIKNGDGSNAKQASIHLQRQRMFTKDQHKSVLMRGSLHRFGKYLVTRLQNQGVTMTITDEDLHTIITAYNSRIEGRINKSVPGLMYINWVVARYFNLEPHEVRDKKTRKAEYIKVKHLAMYLAVTLYGYEYTQVLDFYNLVNHATVVHALENIDDYMETDKHYKKAVEELTDKLLGYDRYTNDEQIIERSDSEVRT